MIMFKSLFPFPVWSYFDSMTFSVALLGEGLVRAPEASFLRNSVMISLLIVSFPDGNSIVGSYLTEVPRKGVLGE